MKTILYSALLALVLGSALNVHAQKIGYTNVEVILAYMPQARDVEKQVSNLEAKLLSALEAKQKYLQQEMMTYQERVSNAAFNPGEKEEFEKRLSNLQEEITRDITAAETKVIEKQSELMKPLQEKLQQAINEVAVQDGYTYILNQTMGSGIPSILFGDASFDITRPIAAKLGIEMYLPNPGE